MSTLSPARARSSTKTIAIGRAASDVYADLADLSHWPQRAIVNVKEGRPRPGDAWWDMATSPPTFAVSAPQACAAVALDASGTATAGDTGTTYRWDSTAQRYLYNYHTASSLLGQCQTITATLDDGTTQSVRVRLATGSGPAR